MYIHFIYFSSGNRRLSTEGSAAGEWGPTECGNIAEMWRVPARSGNIIQFLNTIIMNTVSGSSIVTSSGSPDLSNGTPWPYDNPSWHLPSRTNVDS
jgi:hypothetical protein